MSADFWIEKLKLEKHPEGGAFREIYRSALEAELPMSDGAFASRNLSTGIYYMLQAGEFSAFHRIRSDEIWHHYDGGDLMIYVLHPSIGLKINHLGKSNPLARPQLCVPGGLWFAAKPAPETQFALCGCTVSPGFDFKDFELANAQELIAEYPNFASDIEGLLLNN